MLQTEEVDLSIERRVLSNLIMSTTLLARCRSAGEPRMFESAPCRIVATWLWDFYDRRGEAPKEAISDIYRQRQRELQQADSELIQAFLDNCSNEWVPTNIALAEDIALNYFRERALAILSEGLSQAAKSGDTTQGERLVAEYVKPSYKVSRAVDPTKDSTAVIRAFNDEDEELFRFPGALGYVVGPFIREDFAAYIAPPKRGKTWWLIATAMTAYLQGQQVLFVSLEMSENQMMRRVWQYLSGCSRYGETAPWPKFVEVSPGKYAIEDRQLNSKRVDATSAGVAKVQQRLASLSRSGNIRLMNFPTGQLTVNQLRAELKNMEVYDNFMPTVVVVDYADIMDHGNSGKDERHRLNATWMALRGLAQERHVAIITASQTGRQTVGGNKDADDADVAEDIRKLAHVTKMMPINQSEEEQERGIFRIKCKSVRDQAVIHDQAVCTSCLAIGRPFVESHLLSEVVVEADDEYEDEERRERPRSRRQGRRPTT